MSSLTNSLTICLVQEAALNEVFTGGVSSYSIVNMVMAYLQSVGYPLPTLPDVSTPNAAAGPLGTAIDQSDTASSHTNAAVTSQLASAATPFEHAASDGAFGAACDAGSLNCEEDVGELLLGFLHFFGHQFDYCQQAVSVREVIILCV